MAFLKRLYIGSLVTAWVLGSVLTAAGHVIVMRLLDPTLDLSRAVAAGTAILLPLALAFSLPFLLLFGIFAALILRRNPQSAASVSRVVAGLSIGAATAFALTAFAQGNGWNVFVTAALAAPVYGGLFSLLIARRASKSHPSPPS